jgi:cytochrome c oxidase subunit 2
MESESTNAMKFGEIVCAMRHGLKARLKIWGLGLAAAAALGTVPQAALAAASAAASAPAAVSSEAAPAAVASTAASAAAAPAAVAVPAGPRFVVAPGGYTPMKPTPGKGMPVDGGYGFQTQYSPNGQYALWIHNSILMPVITVTTLLVLVLLLIVILRFNRRANPVASRTSHNTLLEVVWTGLPVLILAFIAIYSLDLLADQFKPAPAKALTIKATGNQWYWSYSYPDNGGFEVTSNMLPDEKAIANGEPPQLAADYRMVVPAGEPIRLQTTGADVIHAFAVPSLWFKLDAVPGRINEKVLFVKEPGVYYGQCSELCGARHGYMPIVVEALDRPHYNAWVLTHSGAKLDGLPAVPAPAAPASDAAAPAAAPSASPAPAA